MPGRFAQVGSDPGSAPPSSPSSSQSSSRSGQGGSYRNLAYVDVLAKRRPPIAPGVWRAECAQRGEQFRYLT